MRKIHVIALVLVLLPFLAVAQDAPPASQGDSQAPAQGQWQHRGRRPGLAGTIASIDGNTVTLKTMDGQTAKVQLSEQTRYRKERQPAQLSDFKVGDVVFVRGEQKDGVWQADMLAAVPAGMGMGRGTGGMGAGGGAGMARFREGLGKEFIVGEVKAINGTQLTILRPDGVTQNITVDENTSFRKDGQSITLPDIKAGDHIFGRGEMKDNVFVPGVLNVGQPRFMGGPGGAPPQQPQQ
jgi:Domain of unknown function (DUF5666)